MISDRYPMYYKGHPKLYFKRMPIFWWMKKWSYVRFILRELTSVAVAFYSIMLIIQIHSINSGPDVYADFLFWMKSPVAIILHVVAFLLVFYHSLTWFSLAPKAIVIRLGTNRIPGKLIAGVNYVAWVAVSIVLIWVILN